jgi:CRP/FNR family cyclic AMP-dependent transcriptional regulator
MDNVLNDLFTIMRGENNVFNFLTDEDLKNLSTFFAPKIIPAGKYLWDEEILSDYIAFIISGKVELKKETEFKNKNVLLGVYQKGAVLMLDLSLKKVTAEAHDDVMLVIITQENLDRLIETNPVLGAKLLKGLLLKISNRLKRCYDRIIVFF